MGLLDKAKGQATKLADKAQEAGKAGQEKLKDVQAKRKADSLLRDLGAAVWAGRSADEATVRERLKAHEVEHGAVLDDIYIQHFTDMLSGKLAIEAGIAELGRKWRSQGGDKVLAGLNDLYKKQKK